MVHLHTKAATAVAMQEQGLIPGNQYAMWLGPIGYHNYEGLVSTPEEGERLGEELSARARSCCRRAHGFVLWGHSIHEAYMLAFLLNRACEVQIASLAGGVKPYVPPQSVVDIVARAGPHHHRRQRAVQSDDLARWLRKLDREAPEYKT